MAHIPPSAAIFSPSVARLASSVAKDWNYVDNWLLSKYSNRLPPTFERNPETLKILVALAALNESIDEDHDFVANAEASALQILGSSTAGRPAGTSSGAASPATVTETITAAIEDEVLRDGRSAIDALASTSVELGIAYPEPATLGAEITELQTRLFQLEQARAHMEDLQAYVKEQSSGSQDFLEELEGETYRPVASLAKLNLELQRKVKARVLQLQDTRERVAGPSSVPRFAIQQLHEEEAMYVELIAYNKVLDKQIGVFQNLPPDKNLARKQLEALRAELRSATQHRDIVFEGLVERETPRKFR